MLAARPAAAPSSAAADPAHAAAALAAVPAPAEHLHAGRPQVSFFSFFCKFRFCILVNVVIYTLVRFVSIFRF